MDSETDVLDEMPLRFLVGTTASGKSSLGLELAERMDAEILSLDSMSVYRGMDVGTAKPSGAERARVPHHLIDIADPREPFDLQTYVEHARAALRDVYGRGRNALFVGGTGLYLAALVRGLFQGPAADPAVRARIEASGDTPELVERLRGVDPASAERIHANDRRRIVRALEVFEQTGRRLSDLQAEWGNEPSPREQRARIAGLTWPTPVIDARIRERTAAMLDGGWPDEALRLESAGGLGPSAAQALGYAEALALGEGTLARDEAEATIALRTRQFARRQRTWFRRFDITWIEGDAEDRPERALAALSD